MEPLTDHVFELALRQAAAWAHMGVELDVAVNISACSLHDEGLPDRLAGQVAAYGLSPGWPSSDATPCRGSTLPDRWLRSSSTSGCATSRSAGKSASEGCRRRSLDAWV